MADTITCGVCGEPNPPDMEFCQNCQSRLQPLTGPLRGENVPIQPGDVPTKKVTSELEPVLPRWLREARQEARESAKDQQTAASLPQKTVPVPQAQDLLAGLASQTQEGDEETPDWVASITGTSPKKKSPEAESTNVKWVELADEDETATPGVDAKTSEQDDLTTWFKQASVPGTALPMAKSTSDSSSPQLADEEPPKSEEQSPEWLNKLGAEVESGPTATKPLGEFPKVEIPDWLKGLGSEPGEPKSGTVPAVSEDLPAWLQSSKSSSGEATPGGASVEGSTGLPEWSSIAWPAAQDSGATDEGAALGPETAPAESGVVSEGSTFASEAVPGSDVDAIFASMTMPDWLSDVGTASTSAQDNLPPAAQQQEAISPAELPSWVQAMRPVETAMPDVSAQPADLRFEEQGPLSGLHGVLPVIPGAMAPSSKPRIHSIKLEATEQQQAQAAILERILAAEVMPAPIRGGALLRPQPGLRWAISALLLIAVGAALAAGSQVFPLPAAVPNESVGAVQAIEAIPAAAPVLVVFDYEPATVGEMEATAASLMDHLLLLQHPQLALISTSPTGAALAERFMSTTVGERTYRRGVQYVDLGYLPGGLAGVHDFAQNPTAVMPLGSDSTRVWDSGVLPAVTRLSDFASILVLTDSLESGRVWIEQTTGTRGNSSMVIVSSAQAGPMLLPYFDSGQVDGLVAGMNGAVGAEQANGGLPGFVRRYWDAYGIGTYLAAILVVIGSLWNLWRGIQDRLAE